MNALPPLATVLRDYAYGYTAAHDFSVSNRIMVPDYVLHMGPITLRGRGGEYQTATRRQFEEFPGLGFTVHRFVTNGDRAALHFSEHGRSEKTGTSAVWEGISLYRWDGRSLTECRVEQDYHSRRRQLGSGVATEPKPPALDPWAHSQAEASAGTDSAVRRWLGKPGWRRGGAGLVVDDGTEQLVLEQERTEILDLFTAGDTAAFHVLLSGAYAGGLEGCEDRAGTPADLYATGIVRVTPDRRVHGQIITDRLSARRRLAQAGG